MSELIHPTALVSPKASLGEGTRVGAFSIIEDGVVIGKNCDIQDHVVIRSHVTLGDEVKVFPFAVLGGAPQHLGYRDEPTTVVIGNRVTLRESVTVHRGTRFGTGTTTIGDDCFLMAYTHVAHDCHVGKGVIMANAAQLGGHVTVGDYATIGGLTGVTQFCRVGSFCFVGGSSIIRKDLPPFVVGKGQNFEVQGVNAIGLDRRGYSSDTVLLLKKVFKIFFMQNLTVEKAKEKITTEVEQSAEVRAFLDFINSSKLGFVR